MPIYNYICSNANCSKKYLECREVTDPQSYTKCDICNSDYIEVQ